MKNFLKLTGLIFVFSAIVFSSCKKSLDDSGKTYDNAPNVKISGVTALVTDIAGLRSAIAYTQTNIAAVLETSSITSLKTGLTKLSSEIDSIDSTFNKMARLGVATRAIFNGLNADLKLLPTKIAADNAALKTLIASIGTTNPALSTRLNALVNDNNIVTEVVNTIQKSMDNLVVADISHQTQLAVNALKVKLDATKVSYDILLATLLP